MSKVEDIIAASKLSELMNKKEEDKHGKTVLWILALVGAVAAVAGIAYAVYCLDRKSTRLNSSHDRQSRMPSSA